MKSKIVMKPKTEMKPGTKTRPSTETKPTPEQWNDWKWHMRNRITSEDELRRVLEPTTDGV